MPNNLLSTSSSPNYVPKDHYLISCGIPHKSSPDGGKWRSDEDQTFSPSASAMAAATTSTTGDYDAQPPYNTARIFHAPFSYAIPLSSPGPKLVRLYFSPSTRYNNMDPSNFYLSVNANTFNLLTNFSAYLIASNANTSPKYNAPVTDVVQGLGLVKEFYITVLESDQRLVNLTFLPVPTGFVNGIEIISVPDSLYVPASNYTTDPSVGVGVPYLRGIPGDYHYNFFDFTNRSKLAMETIIRLNVGGSDVAPLADSGFNRIWYDDTNFLMTNISQSIVTYNASTEIKYTQSTPAYTAPKIVYSTMRMMGPSLDLDLKLRMNLTWVFEVDGGFDYLVRLHFCELLPEINQVSDRVFNIYVNNQTAAERVDVFFIAGGRQIPIHKDFVTYVDASGDDTSRHGSRVHLWVVLRPDLGNYKNADAFLNGLEIFKLSNANGSLAAPNPSAVIPSGPKNATPSEKSSHHWLLPIIGGGVGLIVLISLLTFLIYLCRHHRTKAVNMNDASILSKPSTNHTSKTDWVPIGTFESVSTTSFGMPSSLPSHLCQRFSLAQIRVATADFDESLVIGTGGFGKVYKGSIDGGSTTVAIKRLNQSSKQGSHEFHNEIKLLSGLSHLHLVSLIGYCEDQGEMILIYEYMPRGTLRDHLYKNSKGHITGTPLSWKQRLMICVGSARGLHYLHRGAKEVIIHRDVKSTNILLDDNWMAKVSDFGLSKVGPAIEAGISHVSTAVKGSVGYLDPEYYKRKKLTEKSDVYSFGVVLLEVLCARPPINPYLPKNQVNLVKWARKCNRSGTLHTIVDPNLMGQIAPESLSKFVEIAEMCVHDQGSQRPSMGDVVWALDFALQLQDAHTGDKNNLVGGSLGETSASKARNSSSTDDNMFSTSGENLSNSSGTGEMGQAKSNNNFSNSNDHENMRSCSVFSEIMDQPGR